MWNPRTREHEGTVDCRLDLTVDDACDLIKALQHLVDLVDQNG